MNEDKSINNEVTEELTDLINNIDSEIESLEETTKKGEYDDFSGLVKKRDYKGYSKELETKSKKTTHKRRLKKWVYVVFVILLLVFGFGTYKLINAKRLSNEREARNELIKNIKSHYDQYVKVSSDTSLFDSDYKKVGIVYKDANLELDDIDIDASTKYFKIKDLDYYISYSDVEKSTQLDNNDRYKKYLPFNINIITKDTFSMYDGDTKIITLDKEMEFPVIINDYE